MTDRTSTIIVDGVRELGSALRKTAGSTPKEIAKWHQTVAELVAREARRRAASRPRKTNTGRIESTIRASGTQREAAVKVGGIRGVGDAHVQEFGGRAPLFGNRSNWNQVRTPNSEGYFLYPAVRESQPTVTRIYLRGLDEAIRQYWSRV